MADNEPEFTFPTLSSNVTEEEKTLSLKEKVNLIDNEIRQLYEFCTKAGWLHTASNRAMCTTSYFPPRQRNSKAHQVVKAVILVCYTGSRDRLFVCL